jgi:hypothetical protein
MPTFSGHVQYDDWKGTAAADESDHKGIRSYLEEQGLLRDGEFVVGLEMYSGAALGTERYFSARVYLVEAGNFEGAVKVAVSHDPVEVIVRDLPLSLEEFLSFFKRFDLNLTRRGLDLQGREYREIER